MSDQDTPTVVLVHGGYADASFWVPVIKDLQADRFGTGTGCPPRRLLL